MKILAFDMSTPACTVALQVDGSITWRHQLMQNRHTDYVLSMMTALILEAGIPLSELDAIAFGVGPGSFTGVRLSAALAQGIGFGLDIPVIPISTLQTIAGYAHRTHQMEQTLVAWDARMGEVYWGQYRYDVDSDGMGAVVPDAILSPKDVTVDLSGRCIGLGNAWLIYTDILKEAVEKQGCSIVMVQEAYPHARDMLPWASRQFLAGLGLPATQARPVYLRNPIYATPSTH